MNGHLTEKALALHLKSPALGGIRDGFPERFGGRVPRIVRLTRSIMSPPPYNGVRFDPIVLSSDSDFYAFTNRHGAVSAITGEGRMLGLLPTEFVVVEFVRTGAERENPPPRSPSPSAVVPSPETRQVNPLVGPDFLFAVEVSLMFCGIVAFFACAFFDTEAYPWSAAAFVTAAAIVGICRELRARGRTHSEASPDHHGR